MSYDPDEKHKNKHATEASTNFKIDYERSVEFALSDRDPRVQRELRAEYFRIIEALEVSYDVDADSPTPTPPALDLHIAKQVVSRCATVFQARGIDPGYFLGTRRSPSERRAA